MIRLIFDTCSNQNQYPFVEEAPENMTAMQYTSNCKDDTCEEKKDLYYIILGLVSILQLAAALQ